MDGARQTEQTRAPELDALRFENAQLRDRAEKAEAMYRQRDAEASAWQQTANDLYTGNPPSEPDIAAGLKLMQEHMRQRDQMKQERDAAMRCAKQAERERDDTAEDLRAIEILLGADKQWTKPAMEACDALLTERDSLRARLADLERWREQAGWQPIETAPQDAWILAFWSGLRAPAPPSVVRWQSDCWCDEEGEPLIEPTHWMPLPAPPKVTQ